MTTNVTSLSDRLKGKGRRLKFAIGRTVQNKKVKNVEFKWIEFVEKLKHVVRTPEKHDDYMKMAVAAQNDIKDQGYFVAGHFAAGTRKRENLELKCVITLDADHMPSAWHDDAAMAFDHLEYVSHTTHKHSPEKPRVRFVFPLTRDVDEVEWLAICRRVGSWLGLNYIDHTTFQFSRVMHFGSASIDGEYEFHHNEGAWLDADEVLATYTDWRDVTQWPISDNETKEIRLSAQKAGNPLEKPGVIGAFCRAYSIVEAMGKFIPDAYLEGDGPDRFTYAQGSAANGAVIYDDGLFLYSHHEHDPCSGRSVNAFDLVRLHKFGALDENAKDGTAVTKLPSYEAMVDHVQQEPGVMAELASERLQLDAEFDDFGSPVIEEVVRDATLTDLDKELGFELPVEDASKAWTKKLIFVEGQIAIKLTNLELLIDNDERLKGCIAFNEFTRDHLLMRPIPGLPRVVPADGLLWDDLFEVSIKGYLERRHRLTFSAAMVHEAVMTLGSRNTIHPVREYLDGLPSWDGVERLNGFFVREFGAEDSAYVHAVTRKWFCALIARIYVPGIKFDYALILEGVEGLRKSALLETLAGGYFTDSLSFGLDAKEVIELTRNTWIAEIPEMITRSTADNEHNKAFLSRRTDRARLSYARNSNDFPRQFVIAGSTNELAAGYLRSLTGNRRFWPLKGDGRTLDLERIAGYRDQLLAEAKEAWQWGEVLYLDDEGVLAEAKEQQAARIVTDDLSLAIGPWLDKEIPETYWDVERGASTEFDEFDDPVALRQRDRVSSLEIWIECLGGDLRTFGKREGMRINDVMRNLPDWRESATVRFGVRYGRGRGFVRDVNPPK